MSAFAGIALLGVALGVTKRKTAESAQEEFENLRERFAREREEARKARRAEDRLRVEERRAFPGRQRESRTVEIRRITPEGEKARPQARSKAEVYTAVQRANRASVQKYVAELRKAINKKSVGRARSALKALERAVTKLDTVADKLMINQAHRVMKVARSRGI